METPVHEVVIISDLHLGSETSRAREALRLLRSLVFCRLVLLGDIFCDLNFRRLTKDHWHFLSFIRKLSNPKRGVEVIWVKGNHDHGLTDVMSHLVGVHVHQEYMWESEGQQNLAIHGHQFDKFIVCNRFMMSRFVTQLYLLFQKLDKNGKRLSRFLDRLNTRWQRLTPKVAEGALSYVQSRGAERVFCGHTHEPFSAVANGIHYYNTGAWTNACPTYITVDGREVAINEYVERTDNRDPGEERGETVAAFAEFAPAPGLPVDVEYESLCR